MGKVSTASVSDRCLSRIAVQLYAQAHRSLTLAALISRKNCATRFKSCYPYNLFRKCKSCKILSRRDSPRISRMDDKQSPQSQHGKIELQYQNRADTSKELRTKQRHIAVTVLLSLAVPIFGVLLPLVFFFFTAGPPFTPEWNGGAQWLDRLFCGRKTLAVAAGIICGGCFLYRVQTNRS